MEVKLIIFVYISGKFTYPLRLRRFLTPGSINCLFEEVNEKRINLAMLQQ